MVKQCCETCQFFAVWVRDALGATGRCRYTPVPSAARMSIIVFSEDGEECPCWAVKKTETPQETQE